MEAHAEKDALTGDSHRPLRGPGRPRVDGCPAVRSAGHRWGIRRCRMRGALVPPPRAPPAGGGCGVAGLGLAGVHRAFGAICLCRGGVVPGAFAGPWTPLAPALADAILFRRGGHRARRRAPGLWIRARARLGNLSCPVVVRVPAGGWLGCGGGGGWWAPGLSVRVEEGRPAGPERGEGRRRAGGRCGGAVEETQQGKGRGAGTRRRLAGRPWGCRRSSEAVSRFAVNGDAGKVLLVGTGWHPAPATTRTPQRKEPHRDVCQ